MRFLQQFKKKKKAQTCKRELNITDYAVGFLANKKCLCVYAQILIQNLRMEVFELALAED